VSPFHGYPIYPEDYATQQFLYRLYKLKNITIIIRQKITEPTILGYKPFEKITMSNPNPIPIKVNKMIIIYEIIFSYFDVRLEISQPMEIEKQTKERIIPKRNKKRTPVMAIPMIIIIPIMTKAIDQELRTFLYFIALHP